MTEAATAWRDAHAEIETALAAHTPLAHLISGRPLRRLWANLKRPMRERRDLMEINDARSARGILDHLCRQNGLSS